MLHSDKVIQMLIWLKDKTISFWLIINFYIVLPFFLKTIFFWFQNIITKSTPCSSISWCHKITSTGSGSLLVSNNSTTIHDQYKEFNCNVDESLEINHAYVGRTKPNILRENKQYKYADFGLKTTIVFCMYRSFNWYTYEFFFCYALVILVRVIAETDNSS